MKRTFSRKQSKLVDISLLLLFVVSFWTPFQEKMIIVLLFLHTLTSYITEKPLEEEKQKVDRHWKLAGKIIFAFSIILLVKAFAYDMPKAWQETQPPVATIKVNDKSAGVVLGKYKWKENGTGNMSTYSTAQQSEPVKVAQPLSLSISFDKEPPVVNKSV